MNVATVVAPAISGNRIGNQPIPFTTSCRASVIKCILSTAIKPAALDAKTNAVAISTNWIDISVATVVATVAKPTIITAPASCPATSLRAVVIIFKLSKLINPPKADAPARAPAIAITSTERITATVAAAVPRATINSAPVNAPATWVKASFNFWIFSRLMIPANALAAAKPPAIATNSTDKTAATAPATAPIIANGSNKVNIVEAPITAKSIFWIPAKLIAAPRPEANARVVPASTRVVPIIAAAAPDTAPMMVNGSIAVKIAPDRAIPAINNPSPAKLIWEATFEASSSVCAATSRPTPIAAIATPIAIPNAARASASTIIAPAATPIAGANGASNEAAAARTPISTANPANANAPSNPAVANVCAATPNKIRLAANPANTPTPINNSGLDNGSIKACNALPIPPVKVTTKSIMPPRIPCSHLNIVLIPVITTFPIVLIPVDIISPIEVITCCTELANP